MTENRSFKSINKIDRHIHHVNSLYGFIQSFRTWVAAKFVKHYTGMCNLLIGNIVFAFLHQKWPLSRFTYFMTVDSPPPLLVFFYNWALLLDIIQQAYKR